MLISHLRKSTTVPRKSATVTTRKTSYLPFFSKFSKNHHLTFFWKLGSIGKFLNNKNISLKVVFSMNIDFLVPIFFYEIGSLFTNHVDAGLWMTPRYGRHYRGINHSEVFYTVHF